MLSSWLISDCLSTLTASSHLSFNVFVFISDKHVFISATNSRKYSWSLTCCLKAFVVRQNPFGTLYFPEDFEIAKLNAFPPTNDLMLQAGSSSVTMSGTWLVWHMSDLWFLSLSTAFKFSVSEAAASSSGNTLTSGFICIPYPGLPFIANCRYFTLCLESLKQFLAISSQTEYNVLSSLSSCGNFNVLVASLLITFCSWCNWIGCVSPIGKVK